MSEKLAVKQLDPLADDWTIQIEVLDGMPESISLPIAINEVEGLETALNDKVRAESLNIHVADRTNPHAVTATQIGVELRGAGMAAATNAIAQHESTTNHPLATTGAKGMMSKEDKTKLDTIATGATANSTDAQLRDRTLHTGFQPISTITGLQSAIDSKQAASANLTNLAAISTTGAIERNSDGTTTTYTVTSAGKALIDDVDGASQRATLGLGTLALKSNLIATDIPDLDTAKITSGVLPIARGGTNSNIKNFVDLNTNQSINGEKTFIIIYFALPQ